MEGKLDLLLFDHSENLIEQTSIKKPKTYNELLALMKTNIKKLPKVTKIFYQKENEKIIINNDSQYKLAQNKIFIYDITNIEKPIPSLDSKKAPIAQKKKSIEKYNYNKHKKKCKETKNEYTKNIINEGLKDKKQENNNQINNIIINEDKHDDINLDLNLKLDDHKVNEIKCIYIPIDGETSIDLLHNYNNKESFTNAEIKNFYLKAKEINKKLFK